MDQERKVRLSYIDNLVFDLGRPAIVDLNGRLSR